ncbi:MAG: cell wall-binding repeat-containing protein, partial [Coriobacteriales bacterium]|nr:cell wall-binding repeat-containing protein [Coriobacteriales bacterium]
NDIYTKGKNYSSSYGGASWNTTTCIIINGTSFADGLSVSPYAYVKHCPIFLTDASGENLDTETIDLINNEGFTKAIFIGSSNAVSDNIKTILKNNTHITSDANIDRWAGTGRYATSLDIANRLLADGDIDVSHICFATGKDFPDALSSSSLAGLTNSVLVLIDPETTSISSNLSTFISSHKSDIKLGFILGSNKTIPDSLKSKLDELITPPTP